MTPAPLPAAGLARLGVLLAALPLASFGLQLLFSAQAGTTAVMFRHYTITYVDWVFVGFNLLAAGGINWLRGRTLFVLVLVSVVANVAAHAQWQQTGLDAGHMIDPAGATLPAGWVHLAYSIVQMALVLVYLACPAPHRRPRLAADAFLVVYFLGAGVSGYLMHDRVAPTDAVLVFGGLSLVLGLRCVRAARDPATTEI